MMVVPVVDGERRTDVRDGEADVCADGRTDGGGICAVACLCIHSNYFLELS